MKNALKKEIGGALLAVGLLLILSSPLWVRSIMQGVELNRKLSWFQRHKSLYDHEAALLLGGAILRQPSEYHESNQDHSLTLNGIVYVGRLSKGSEAIYFPLANNQSGFLFMPDWTTHQSVVTNSVMDINDVAGTPIIKSLVVQRSLGSGWCYVELDES